MLLHLLTIKIPTNFIPPRFAHIYGIDLASPKEMVAYQRDNTAICKALGCDRVIFQTLDDLTDACMEVKSEDVSEPQSFECGVFCGQYATPIPPEYFQHLEELRSKSQPVKISQATPQLVA